MRIDMMEAPLVPLQGKLSEKMHLKGQNGFNTLIFSAQKCRFWPKKGNFNPPQPIEPQYDCFLIVFGPLEPKSITFMHKIMILASLAHFRPTLANWVQ